MLEVTDSASIANAAESVRRRTGQEGLAGLVNNAGFAFDCPLEFAPIDRIRHQLEVNVIGQLAVTQTMLPLIRQSQGGIININSLSGYVAGPYVGPYAASKHAFAALNDALRLELRRFGIRVVQIIPGDIQTPIWQKSRETADQLVDQMADGVRSKLPGEVQDIYAADVQAMRQATRRFAKKALPQFPTWLKSWYRR